MTQNVIYALRYVVASTGAQGCLKELVIIKKIRINISKNKTEKEAKWVKKIR